MVYSGRWVGLTSESEFDLGVRLGIALPLGNDKCFIYFGSAWVTLSSSTENYYGEPMPISYEGNIVPIFLGIKIPVQKHIASISSHCII